MSIIQIWEGAVKVNLSRPRMHIQERYPQLVWCMTPRENFFEQPHRKRGDAHGFQAVRPIGIED